MSSDSSMTIDVPELEKMANPEKEQWERRSIYKLPPCVTSTRKTAYTPQMVSFGPYHYKDEKLKQMECHKRRAQNQFLNRSNLTYDDCCQSLLEIVGELMDAYDWLPPNLDTNIFLEIMIRDGTFMLEIFGDGAKIASGYADNDPIFSEHGNLYVVPHVKRDMLMIENQIPMKVLYNLYKLQHPEKDPNKWQGKDANKWRGKDPNKWQEEEANKVAFQFFFQDEIASVAPPNSLHLLDMYRQVMLGTFTPPITEEKSTIRISGEDIIRSAVELNEAGIKIKKSKNSSIRDISFKKGVLRLPRIVVDDTTESLFLNLMAYERFHVGAGNDVTAYVFFMDNIIDDPQDIRLLHSKNIIQNGIGSDKAAAKMFNSLSKDISLDKRNRLAAIYGSVNAYCKKHIPKYRAALCHTYFTNPWAIISFFAAILLFVLTITQTIYGIKDFYKQDEK